MGGTNWLTPSEQQEKREEWRPRHFRPLPKTTRAILPTLMRPTRHYWDTTSDYDTLDTGHRLRGLPAARTR